MTHLRACCLVLTLVCGVLNAQSTPTKMKGAPARNAAAKAPKPQPTASLQDKPLMAVYEHLVGPKPAHFREDLQAAVRRNGSAPAWFALGVALRHGLADCPRDFVSALEAFHRAADMGHALAQEALFQLYASYPSKLWQGQEARLKTLHDPYASKAEAGDRVAMVNLGMMHQWGVGAEKDLRAAVRWYQRAADLGDGRAMTYLGRIYEFDGGSIIPADRDQAVRLYRLAEAAGNGHGTQNLALALYAESNLPEDQARLTQMLEKALDRGWPMAAPKLAERYREGKGTERPPAFATKVLRGTAAFTFQPDLLCEIAKLGERNDGVSPQEAWKAYEVSMSQPIAYERAIRGMGRMLVSGKHSLPEEERANLIKIVQSLPHSTPAAYAEDALLSLELYALGHPKSDEAGSTAEKLWTWVFLYYAKLEKDLTGAEGRRLMELFDLLATLRPGDPAARRASYRTGFLRYLLDSYGTNIPRRFRRQMEDVIYQYTPDSSKEELNHRRAVIDRIYFFVHDYEPPAPDCSLPPAPGSSWTRDALERAQRRWDDYRDCESRARERLDADLRELRTIAPFLHNFENWAIKERLEANTKAWNSRTSEVSERWQAWQNRIEREKQKAEDRARQASHERFMQSMRQIQADTERRQREFESFLSTLRANQPQRLPGF